MTKTGLLHISCFYSHDSKKVNICWLSCPDLIKVGWDSSVGITTRYGLDGPGIESRRAQWPSGLRRGSAADRLLGLLVRIPSGVWMFVLCVLYSKEQKTRPGQSDQRSTDKVQRTNKKSRWGQIFRMRPDRSWGPPSLLYYGYRVSFPGVKRPGGGVNLHPI